MKQKITKKRPITFLLALIMIFSLSNAGDIAEVKAGESKDPSVRYQTGSIKSVGTVSGFIFLAYNGSISVPDDDGNYSVEGSRSGYIIMTHPQTSENPIDTAGVMSACEQFLTDNNISMDEVCGMVIEGDIIRISEPIHIPYIEMTGDVICYGEEYVPEEETDNEDTEDEDLEEDEKNVETAAIHTMEVSLSETDSNINPMNDGDNFEFFTKTGICLRADEVILANPDSREWDIDYVDIFADKVSIKNSPVTASQYNITGQSERMAVSVVASVLNKFSMAFEIVEEGYTADSFSEDFNGKVSTFDKTLVKEGVDVTVNFNAAGGECDTNAVVYKYNDVMSDLPVPEKMGYSFEGWYTSAEGGDLVEEDTEVDFLEEKTFYAHWVAKKYTVTLIEDEEDADNTTSTVTAVYGDICSFLPVLEKKEYIFTGWTDKADIVLTPKDIYKIADDVTLYPAWKESNCSHKNTEIKDEKNPSCSEKGYTGDTYCNDCGEIIVFGEEIEKLVHTWDQGVITETPTTSKEGKKTYTCTVCSAVRTVKIAKLDSVTTESSTVPNTTEKTSVNSPTQGTGLHTVTTEITKSLELDGTAEQAKEVAGSKKVKITKVQNISSRKIKIKLKKINGYKYQIKICTSKKFKKGVKTYSTSKTTYTIKKLKKGKTYYVKARTYKKINGKNIYGKWSSVKKVKIKK